MRRFASIQIRNAGTVGGNIANGSPIGDLPPALIALDARLTLRRGPERREIPLEDFFIAYGKQDRAPGEFVEVGLRAAPLRRHALCLLQDLQALRPGHLCRDGRVPAHAEAGRSWTTSASPSAAWRPRPSAPPLPRRRSRGSASTRAAVERAAAALAEDFAPITDMRASAGYRLKAAQNLLSGAFTWRRPRRKAATRVLELAHG